MEDAGVPQLIKIRVDAKGRLIPIDHNLKSLKGQSLNIEIDFRKHSFDKKKKQTKLKTWDTVFLLIMSMSGIIFGLWYALQN